jgi:hypothetical protein
VAPGTIISVALEGRGVPEEATLDAFATEPDDAADSDAVDPVPVTSSWSEDAGTCASCGERARRLWETGGERRCTSCKPWSRSGEDACDQ